MAIRPKHIINGFLALMMVLGIVSFGLSVKPSPALASCNELTEPPIEPEITAISQPSGTYNNPGYIDIAISGETAWTCTGNGNPGFGWVDTMTTVHYRVTNTKGFVIYSNSWSSPWPSSPTGIRHSFTINDSFDASALKAGTYTITAEAWNNSNPEVFYSDPSDVESADFYITKSVSPIPNYTLGCTINKTVSYSSDPSASINYSVFGNAFDGFNSTINVTVDGAPISASPSSTSLYYSGYSGSMNIVYGGLAANNTYYFNFVGNDGSSTRSCSASLEIVALQPEVDIQFNGSNGPVDLNGATDGTISWDNQNVDSCTATTTGGSTNPAWNSSYNISPLSSGSLYVTGIAYGASYTFSLTCYGPGGGPVTDYVQVSTNAQTPTLDVTCRQGSFYNQGPCSVYSGGSTRIRWYGDHLYENDCTVYRDGIVIATTQPTTYLAWNTGNLANPPQSSYTFTVQCTAPAYPYTMSDSVTIDVIGYPTADIDCTTSITGGPTDGPCVVSSGSTASLTWVSSSADSCSIDNGLGGVSTTGSYTTSALNNPPSASVTYTLSCSGPGGSATDSVTINVNSLPSPGVDLQCTDPVSGPKDGPCTIAYNSQANLSWSTYSITSGSCILYRDGVSLGTVANNSSGYLTPSSSPYLTSATRYNLVCSGPGSPYSASDAVEIDVAAPPLGVDIDCTDSTGGPKDGPCSVPYGSPVNLSWTYSNCSSVDINYGIGNYTYSPGSTMSDSITSTTTFIITCNGVGGPIYDSVTVAVGADWDLSCSPSTITVTQGGSGTYNLSSSSVGGFGDYISYSGPSWSSPAPSIAPSFSFYGNGQYVGGTTTANFTTNTSTSIGTYNLTFTGLGGGKSHSCIVQIIVNPVPLSVDIDCTDSAGGPKDGPCSVPYNGSATISWTSSNCTNVYINPNGWVGSSGSFSTGALTSFRTYYITCYGAAGETYDSVTVGVGSDWTLACSQPSVSVIQGGSGSYNLSTTGLGGFSSAINFSGPSYSPTPGAAPSFSFTSNNQVPNATTVATFSTTTSTTPGTYTLTFSGTGGSLTRSCSVQLIVVAPALSADIDCTDSAGGPKDGPCSVPYNGSATISWTSSNCTSTSIDQGIGTVATSGSTSTGALTSSVTYTFTCNGTGGPVYDYVTVSVGSDWDLSCSPSSISVTQGGFGSYNLTTTSLGGFASAVAFSNPSIWPSPSVAPSFSLSGNNQAPNATTVASFSAINATPGTYTLTFSGTGGSISKSCNVQLIVTSPPLTVDIDCTDSAGGPKDGPCAVTSGSSATVSWSSTNCSSVYIDNSVGYVSASGSTSTGTMTASRTYTITCNGVGGPIYDTVNLTVGADWDLSCSPSTITVSQGSPGSFNLSTTSLGGYDGVITFSSPSYSPTPGIAPNFSFSNNAQVPNATTVASFTTNTSTSAGTYNLTFRGDGVTSGKSGTTITHSCAVQLVVNPVPPTAPNPPTVTTSNTTCGQIDVNWTAGAQPPTVTDYVVYYSSPSGAGTWTGISPLPWNGSYTFSHNSSNTIRVPSASNNYYKVRAYNGVSYTDSAVVGPTGLTPCTILIGPSDKDVKQVSGLVNKTFTASACSGASEVATLPNNGLFSPGDIVTFQINVCNSGSAPLTGITVVDTLQNLSSPTTATSPTGCLTGQSYDSVTRTLTFNTSDVPAGNGTMQVCSIVFTAVVTTPSSATASLYRFQNLARIYGTQISADPATFPLGYYPVSTPPYLFGITSNIPDRGETSPQ